MASSSCDIVIMHRHHHHGMASTFHGQQLSMVNFLVVVVNFLADGQLSGWMVGSMVGWSDPWNSWNSWKVGRKVRKLVGKSESWPESCFPGPRPGIPGIQESWPESCFQAWNRRSGPTFGTFWPVSRLVPTLQQAGLCFPSGLIQKVVKNSTFAVRPKDPVYGNTS